MTRGRPSTNWVQVPALPLHSHSPWGKPPQGQSTRIHVYVLEKGQLGLLGGREEVLVRAGICRCSERPAHLWPLSSLSKLSASSLFSCFPSSHCSPRLVSGPERQWSSLAKNTEASLPCSPGDRTLLFCLKLWSWIGSSRSRGRMGPAYVGEGI